MQAKLGETPATVLLDELPARKSRLKPARRHVGYGMLRQILLLQRDVPKAARFYQEGLGLKVKVLTERWAELDAGSTILALKAVEGYGKTCARLHLFYVYGPQACEVICAGRLTAPQATHLFCRSRW